MGNLRYLGTSGNDGTGTKPIPYGPYLNLYRDSYGGSVPSESYVRMQQNTSLAFGCTFMSAFVYNDMGTEFPVMFKGPGDASSNTTPVFNYVADANRQSRNLGPALVRLASTNACMIGGSAYGAGNVPNLVWAWTPGAGDKTVNFFTGQITSSGYTDYIAGITPYTNSTPHGGTVDSTYNDIIIGYFKPLLSDNTGNTFCNGLEFMIVNAAWTGTSDASKQWYHILFDFSGSSFNSLARLDSDTGLVEAVSLTHLSGSQYYLDLLLGGGEAAFFTFWNSNTPLPTIGVPEPSTLALAISGLIGLLAYAWRKRK